MPDPYAAAIHGYDPTELASYDPPRDTFMDPDAPVTICDRHTERDIDPRSGRCWECGQTAWVALQLLP